MVHFRIAPTQYSAENLTPNAFAHQLIPDTPPFHANASPIKAPKPEQMLHDKSAKLPKISNLPLTIIVLASLVFAAFFCVLVFALALLAASSVVFARVVLVGMWLSLHEHVEVLSRISNSVDKAIFSIWPLAVELFLLVIFGK